MNRTHFHDGYVPQRDYRELIKNVTKHPEYNVLTSKVMDRLISYHYTYLNLLDDLARLERENDELNQMLAMQMDSTSSIPEEEFPQPEDFEPT